MDYSRAQLPIGASWVWTISQYKQRQPGCCVHQLSWVNETEGSTLPEHPPPPPRGLPSAPGKMDLKRGQLPTRPPPNEQMEASATIITTLPGSLLTNRNNTSDSNKPQSNMTLPLMPLTPPSLQGRTGRTDSFSSTAQLRARFLTLWSQHAGHWNDILTAYFCFSSGSQSSCEMRHG